jgi:hypothetical protein
LDNDDDRGEQQEENNCEKSGWHGTKQRLSGVPLGCFTGEAVPGSEQPREEFFGQPDLRTFTIDPRDGQNG